MSVVSGQYSNGLAYSQQEEYKQLMQVIQGRFSNQLGMEPDWEPIQTFNYNPDYRKMRVTNKTDSQAFTVTFIPEQKLKVNPGEAVDRIRKNRDRLLNSRIDALLNTVIDEIAVPYPNRYFAILQKFYAQPLVRVFHRGSDPTASDQLVPPPGQNGSQAQPSQAAIQKSTVTTVAVIDYLIGAILIVDQITQKGLRLRLQDVNLANFLVVKSAYSNTSGIAKSKLEASRLLMNFEDPEPYMDLPDASYQPEPWQILRKLAEVFLPHFHRALHNLPEELPFEKINFKQSLAFMAMSNAGLYVPLIRLLVDLPNNPISLQDFVRKLKEPAPEFNELRTKHDETFRQYENLASTIQPSLSGQVETNQPMQADPRKSQAGQQYQGGMNEEVRKDSRIQKASSVIMQSVMGVKQIADITNGLDSDDIHYGLAQIQIDFMSNYIKFCTTALSDLRFLCKTFKMPPEEGHQMLLHYNWALQATLEGLGLRIQTKIEETHRHVMKQEGLPLFEMIEAQKKSLEKPFAAWRKVIDYHYREWNSAFKASITNLGELMRLSERIYTNPNSSSVEEILGHLKDIFFTFYVVSIEFLESQSFKSTNINFNSQDLGYSGLDARSSYHKALWKCLYQLHFVNLSWGYFPTELGPSVDFIQLKSYIRHSDNAEQLKQELSQSLKPTKSMFTS